MDYNILKKSIKFKDRNFPVEIFCKEQYEDYYIRGQVIDLSSIDYPLLSRRAFVTYHFIIFVLVHKKYIEKFNRPLAFLTTIHNSEFCSFTDSTPENFRSFQKMGEYDAKNDKLCSGNFKGINKNPIISIKLKDVPIFDNQYLKDSIKAEKDIILLDLSVHLYKEYSSLEHSLDLKRNDANFKNFVLCSTTRIHGICGNHLRGRKESDEKTVFDWFADLYKKIYWKLEYRHLGEYDFFNILSNYGHLSHKKIFFSAEPINITKYIGFLNIFAVLWKDDNIYPLTRFCNSFFYDLIDDLKSSNIIGQCQRCGNYFRYLKVKKCCSFKSEGKDCGESARNKRYYEAHKKTILPNAPKVTRELRDWYKEKGIKK